MKQLIILATLLVTILSHSAGAEDFNVLWEMDFPVFAKHVHVSDDGKYFFYNDEGYIKLHDSETGNLINQLEDNNIILWIGAEYYLNNDKIVLPFSLDSILVYNIADKRTEETIDLEYNIENVEIDEVSLSPNKRFLTLVCLINGEGHIIIIDLELKKLYKDILAYSDIHQLFNTNDPNRMIVVTSDQHGKHLIEITINDEHPYGYNRNFIEDGEIRGQKFDADEDAFYYLLLSEEKGYKLIKYGLETNKETILYENFILANEKYWFNDDDDIIIFEHGTLRNLANGNYIKLDIDGTSRDVISSCNGLETILIREYTSLQGHKLGRIEANDFLTDIETGRTSKNYLYPNPSSGMLNISFTNQHSSVFQYEVISTSGQVVQSAGLGYLQLEVNSIDLDISSIANGHYTLRVFSDREEFVFNVIKGE